MGRVGDTRKPDYRLAAMNKATDEKNRNVGAAWVNDDGSIAIRMEPFVILPSGPDLVMTLFPNDYNPDHRIWNGATTPQEGNNDDERF